MELQYAKKLLADKRGGLVSLQEQMRETRELDETQQESAGALSSHDQHPADTATQTFQREQDQSITERLSHDLSEIDEAIQRIENGDYGRCELCGKAISDERLEILPATRYCLEHAPRQVGPASEARAKATREPDEV